jgi:hypothetical protein
VDPSGDSAGRLAQARPSLPVHGIREHAGGTR